MDKYNNVFINSFLTNFNDANIKKIQITILKNHTQNIPTK